MEIEHKAHRLAILAGDISSGMLLVLIVTVLVGLSLLALMRVCQSRLLASASPSTPAHLPPVSILKPLKGVDADLERNLRSVFQLDYPQFEILFGVEDPRDPALGVVRGLAVRFPHVAIRIVASKQRIGLNPKVNNLANLLEHARHETVLVSDSNVRLGRNYLTDLVAHLEQPGVGLVSSPIRGQGGSGLGGWMERVQLNTFVMGGVSAVQGALKMPCVVGKSMLMRRSDLAAIGGFAFLSRFLAEDQICGEEMVRAGKKIVTASQCIDQHLGAVSVTQFAQRHLRWAQMRRRVNLAGYLGEFLLNPVFVTLLGALAFPRFETFALIACALAAKCVLEASAEDELGAGMPWFYYPPVIFAKDVSIGVLWFVPFFSSTVSWRGRPLQLGKRTQLLASGEEIPEPAEPAWSEVA